MNNLDHRDDLRHQQRLRQSFRSHWAHNHVTKRSARFFRKSLTMDPARSFFKQLSESNMSITRCLGEDTVRQYLDSANEFDIGCSAMSDLSSSMY